MRVGESLRLRRYAIVVGPGVVDVVASLPVAARHGLLRDQARSLQGAWVTCASESMTPTVRPGQRVRVRSGAGKRPRVRSGAVVLFETNTGEQLVLHRVVFASRWLPWFVHVGDAGQRAGISRRERVVGVADLPRRRPSVSALWKSSARVIRAARRMASR